MISNNNAEALDSNISCHKCIVVLEFRTLAMSFATEGNAEKR